MADGRKRRSAVADNDLHITAKRSQKRTIAGRGAGFGNEHTKAPSSENSETRGLETREVPSVRHNDHRSPAAVSARPSGMGQTPGPVTAGTGVGSYLPHRPRIGAASRFQLKAPFAKEYAELQITEVDRPRRIVEEIRVGRRGRNRSLAVYDFSDEGRGVTRVELTTFSEPATTIDRIRELGAAGWLKRQTAKALKRLRMIFEEPPSGELKRATIAGYDPAKAARFGVATGTDPARAPRREAS